MRFCDDRSFTKGASHKASTCTCSLLEVQPETTSEIIGGVLQVLHSSDDKGPQKLAKWIVFPFFLCLLDNCILGLDFLLVARPSGISTACGIGSTYEPSLNKHVSHFFVWRCDPSGERELLQFLRLAVLGLASVRVGHVRNFLRLLSFNIHDVVRTCSFSFLKRVQLSR